MTRDTADVNDGRPTILGERLLLAFKFFERFCVYYTPKWESQKFPFWFTFFARDDKGFKHPFGIGHWIGEIALRSPSRETVDATFNEMERGKMSFFIDDVVREAIDTTMQGVNANRLTSADIEFLSEHLRHFLYGVAADEFNGRDLALPMPDS